MCSSLLTELNVLLKEPAIQFDKKMSKDSASATQSVQQFRHRIHTVQIIFDNSDYQSAFDTLVVNLTPGAGQWPLQTVFIAESLKDDFLQVLSNKWPRITYSGSDAHEYDTVIAKTNGQLWTNGAWNAVLLIHVPTKYATECKGNWITVNFFRTPKDVYQLLRSESSNDTNWEFASVWTENIALLYQTVLQLKSHAVWNNCYGVFGTDIVPRPIAEQNWSLDVPASKR